MRGEMVMRDGRELSVNFLLQTSIVANLGLGMGLWFKNSPTTLGHTRQPWFQCLSRFVPLLAFWRRSLSSLKSGPSVPPAAELDALPPLPPAALLLDALPVALPVAALLVALLGSLLGCVCGVELRDIAFFHIFKLQHKVLFAKKNKNRQLLSKNSFLFVKIPWGYYVILS